MRELHSIEAEQSLVGGLIIDPKRYDDVNDLIATQKFADLACQVVWQGIEALHDAGKPIDLVTIDHYLEEKNKELYQHIGGISFLADLVQGTPSTANIRNYAQMIDGFARERDLYEAATEIQQVLMRDGLSTDERFQEAEAIFTAMNQEDVDDGSVVDMRQAVKNYIDKLDHRFHNPGIHGLETNIKPIDERLMGLKPGELYVVAARPAMGKTTYAMNIGANIALNGKQVYVSSLEMPQDQLVQRMMAYVGHISLKKLKTAEVLGCSEESSKVVPTASKLMNMGMRIDDTASLDVNELRSRCRRMKRKQGLDLVIVDYLQLLTDRRVNGRFEEISSISRKLKALAKELDCSVIALSQLSRKCEERTDKRPMNSDLRESGQIEQDADVIQFLYRDEVYNTDTQHKGVVEIITGKFRDGEIGTDYLAFIGAQNRIAELSYVPQQQMPTQQSSRGFE